MDKKYTILRSGFASYRGITYDPIFESDYISDIEMKLGEFVLQGCALDQLFVVSRVDFDVECSVSVKEKK